MKLTAICTVDGDGELVREVVVRTEPETLAGFLRDRGLCLERIGLEAGPMSSWLHDGQNAAGYILGAWRAADVTP